MRGTSSHSDLKLGASLCLGQSLSLKFSYLDWRQGVFPTIAKPKTVRCHVCHPDPHDDMSCLHSWRPYSGKCVILSAESPRKGSLKAIGLSSFIVWSDFGLPIFFLRNFELQFCHVIAGTSTELICAVVFRCDHQSWSFMSLGFVCCTLCTAGAVVHCILSSLLEVFPRQKEKSIVNWGCVLKDLPRVTYRS